MKKVVQNESINIKKISVECDQNHRVMSCKIKFASEEDLKKFQERGLDQSRLAVKLDSTTLSFGANKQFYGEIALMLDEVCEIVSPKIKEETIRQFKIAEQELLSTPILSLSQIFRNWSIERHTTIAVNPIGNANLVSIEVGDRLIDIPDMGWSEYADKERAKYSTICKIVFATPDLAATYYKRLTNCEDAELQGAAVILGPRKCLDNFRKELRECYRDYSNDYNEQNKFERSIKIEKISIKCDEKTQTISFKVKFASSSDLEAFKNTESLYKHPRFHSGYVLDSTTFMFSANQQFKYEIYELLTAIYKIYSIKIATSFQEAERQYNEAVEELLEKPISHLSQIFKEWNVTTDVQDGYSCKATNLAKNPIILWIKERESIKKIPDISWSEYSSEERITYQKFCEIKFARYDLAATYYMCLMDRDDAQLSGATVTLGPRECLNDFKKELRECARYYVSNNNNNDEQKSNFGTGSPTKFRESTTQMPSGNQGKLKPSNP